jgi:transposase
MCAMTAARCNPVIRELYQRLPQAGKPNKVARTACMRKVLVILNAMMRSKTCWQPT